MKTVLHKAYTRLLFLNSLKYEQLRQSLKISDISDS